MPQPDAESGLAPLFRWAGSKRKVIPRLAEHWNTTYQRYVEPFAGSAALFFHIRPGRALLSDINVELIETYRVLREQPDDLHAAVSAIRGGRRAYYRLRAQCPATLTSFDRAVRFVYLNRHCFNGIYRTNTNGEFNVPYSGSRSGGIPPVTCFRQCSHALDGALLAACDFGSTIARVRKGDFVYLDPPYTVSRRRVFRQYDRRGFSVLDLERLSEHLKSIHSRGAHFILSYADSREARTVLAGWNTKRIQVRRNVAGFAGARRMAMEVLATNIPAAG